MRPLFDFVLIERETLQSRTTILIPKTAEKRNAPAKGKVVAVGPNADQSIKPGDDVIFGQHAGADIEVNGKQLYVLKDVDILVRINERNEDRELREAA